MGATVQQPKPNPKGEGWLCSFCDTPAERIAETSCTDCKTAAKQSEKDAAKAEKDRLSAVKGWEKLEADLRALIEADAPREELAPLGREFHAGLQAEAEAAKERDRLLREAGALSNPHAHPVYACDVHADKLEV